MEFIRAKYPWVFDYNGMRSEMYYMPQTSQLAPEDHPTQWVGNKSVEYIENYSSDKPMFLFSSFIHPHPPYCPPSPWQKLYREDPPRRSCRRRRSLRASPRSSASAARASAST